jgi:hypothetical protein
LEDGQYSFRDEWGRLSSHSGRPGLRRLRRGRGIDALEALKIKPKHWLPNRFFAAPLV